MPQRWFNRPGLTFAGILIAAAIPVTSLAQAPLRPSVPLVAPVPPPALDLSDLLHLTAEHHPRLAQVAFTIEAARGRAVQEGLCPNPTVSVTGDELSDRTGPGGIWTSSVSQEIVTAKKLQLSRAVALKEVNQAELTLIAERSRLFTSVRQSYYEVLTLQRRVEILGKLVKSAEQTVKTAEKLAAAKEAPRIDVVQLEVDRERFQADLEADQDALPAAFRRLAAAVGVHDLPDAPVVGSLDAAPPEFDLERTRTYVLAIHPEVRSAQIGVERAQIALRRAQVEPIPNVTLRAGYTRQNENQSDDWDIGVSVPVPLWNRNQGNILAAQARLGEAVQEIGRVENDLVARLATAYGAYASARKRAERYRTAVLSKAQETYDLSLKAYQGGQLEYLRVLQAQRAVAEANLEYVRSLGEMWRSASEIEGLMLEDEQPCLPPAP